MARLAAIARLMKNGMGQTSSQPAPETSEQLGSGDELKVEKGKGRKHKRKKRKSAESEAQSKEEESARALLELKNGVGLDFKAGVNDDDLAASAQLVAESSPYRPSRTAIDGTLAHTRQRSKHKEKGHRSEKKLDVYGELAQLPTGEDLYDSIEAQLQEQPDEVFDLDYLSSAAPPQSQLPEYTIGLDEIDSNDENVAALLQEYENETVPESPIVQHQDTSGTQDEFQLVSAQPYRNGEERAMTSSYQLPSLTYSSPIIGEKDKRKRRKNRSSTKETGPENATACGEGQHALDLSHQDPNGAWLDEGFHLANIAGLTAEDQFPLDPALTDVVVKDSQRVEHLSPEQTAQQEKLKRPSRKRKREANQRCIEAFDNGSHGTSFDLPLSQTEQETILPGIEEPQSGGSQNADQSQTPAQKRKRRMPSAEREPTPPPKRARHKSLGNKVQRGGQKGSAYNPSMIEIAEKGGMFTEVEAAKLRKFRETYCEENDLPERQFNERIQSSARNDQTLKAFWSEVCGILPYRTNHSIQRYCRRQFHNYAARGTWTKEEDEALQLAVAEKGKSWKAVGEMIERLPEDCRDRYRNYHTGAQLQNKWEWTDQEVRYLCKAVNECMQAMAIERHRVKELEYEGRDLPESDTDEETREVQLINWGIVSQKIGGMRSRLQCLYKWKRLKNDDKIQYLKHEGRVRRKIKRIDSGKGPGRNWRLGKSQRRVQNMLPGDKYDFLQALASCGAYEESNIPWKSLGAAPFRAVWSTIDCKTAWTLLKEEVPGFELMSYQNIVNRLLTKLMAEESNRLGEHWIGEGEKRRAKTGGHESKAKSAENVEASDEDEDEDENDPGIVFDEAESGMQDQDDSLFGDEIGDGTTFEPSTNGDGDEGLVEDVEEALVNEDDHDLAPDSADGGVDDQLASQVQLFQNV
ncbi:MAG: hypothetical protein LQ347_005050 [Umbilicaria vellea]|nr:MAG: hypothetical protein LQ347_005050 [Umbilicaria vellea]